MHEVFGRGWAAASRLVDGEGVPADRVFWLHETAPCHCESFDD